MRANRCRRLDARRRRSVLRRRRAGSRAGADRRRSRGQGPGYRSGGREWRRGARRLWRISAARALYRDRSGVELAGAGVFPARHGRRRAADDRRRAPRVRARRRAADGSGLREPQRTERSSTRARPRSAAFSTGSETTASPASRGAASVTRDRHVPPRSVAAAEPVARRLAARARCRAPKRRAARACSVAGHARTRGARRRRRAGAGTRRPRLGVVTDGLAFGFRRMGREDLPLLRAPRARRDRRPGRPAASVRGSAGSADGGRPRAARRT